MPKIFEIEGYRGFFFSNEGTPLEPVHIHIKKGDGEAKFWITPTIALAESWNLKVSELTRAQEIVLGGNEGKFRLTRGDERLIIQP